jgi:hypothetical protein
MFDTSAAAPGYLVSVSVGRPVHAVSGSNWEGSGVAPDVDSPPAAALDRAHLLALERLSTTAQEPRLNEYRWAMASPRARLEPVALSPEQLGAYAGQYGVRRVWVERGGLMFQREQREPVPLVPLGPDLFEFSSDPGTRLRFLRKDGRITGLEMFGRDGEKVPVQRSS